MRVVRADRFALDPTAVQHQVLMSHCGAARLAFNWGLARVKAVMDQRAAGATYGVARAVSRKVGPNDPAAWRRR